MSPSLGMKGPYDLTTKKIDEVVTKKSAGNYALGEVDPSNGKMWVRYVGRSDEDVNARLESWVGKSARYKSFMYSYAASAKEAFEKECNNYHDFSGLDNKEHPKPPEGTNLKCPRCGA